MKKFKLITGGFVMLLLVSLSLISCSSKSPSTPTPQPAPPQKPIESTQNPNNFIPITKLELSSTGIENGIIAPQYGAASTDKLGAMPLESIPLSWSKAPSSTKTYALTIVDYDTVPIMGLPWIHWVACNIPATTTSLPSNASTTMANSMLQGVTSFANGYPLDLVSLKGFQVPREKAFHYGGMVPVNFPHKYTISVFALDTSLNLSEGFGLNDLYNAMEGHVVGQGVLYGTYNAKIEKL